jgi:hypothetical protein
VLVDVTWNCEYCGTACTGQFPEGVYPRFCGPNHAKEAQRRRCYADKIAAGHWVVVPGGAGVLDLSSDGDPVNEYMTMFAGQTCPLCGLPFTGSTREAGQPPPVTFDGGQLHPVLAGRPVTEHFMEQFVALILDPCGCRIPTKDWELCMVGKKAWFARTADVGPQIRAVLAAYEANPPQEV